VLAQADAGAPVPGAPHTFLYVFSSASVSDALRDDAGTPLVDDNSGWCLDVLGGSREPGTPLVIYDCHGGENQRFTYPPASGTGEVRAYGGAMCLDAYTGLGQDGDRIVVWPCHGGANQQWMCTLGGELRGVNGKCIDVRR
jgi:hypothetical protein